MSQTAAMRTLGTWASAFISARQRPPVPIRPTWMVSLAPRTLTAGTPKAASPAAVAAELFRKERRESRRFADMVQTSWLEQAGAGGGQFYPTTQTAGKKIVAQ